MAIERYAVIFSLALAMLAPPTLAQQVDEIVVTARRQGGPPGVFMIKRGDYLLLEVKIENDSRELTARTEEIEQTVAKLVDAAKKDPSVTLNLIDDTDLVRPLSMSTFKSGIHPGERPDTSVGNFRVKTKIPDKVADSYKLAHKLAEFVENVEVVGRTELKADGEITVSVVNPYQYREQVLDLVLEDIKKVTTKLGPDYRVIAEGLDKELEWTRSGDLSLAFYIPYSYVVVPTSVHNMIDY